MIVAFTAHPRDVHMEGNYWLALLSGPAFPVPESQASHALVGPISAKLLSKLTAFLRCPACRFARRTSLRLDGSL
eukprot:6921076-Prymnesium_polylepis.1